MSSKGTSTFILQRLTAVVMLPFIAWFLWSIVAHAGGSFADTKVWITKPFNAIMLGVLITVGAVHMRIGAMEVIEDYIHDGLNGVLNMANWAVAIAVIAATWWSLFTLLSA